MPRTPRCSEKRSRRWRQIPRSRCLQVLAVIFCPCSVCTCKAKRLVKKVGNTVLTQITVFHRIIHKPALQLNRTGRAIVFLAVTLSLGSACAHSDARGVAALCSNISRQEVTKYFQYGDAVLFAEISLIGKPVTNGMGEYGRGFSGSITRTFSVRPLRFFKNAGRLSDTPFTVIDVEHYGADGGYQGGGLLPDGQAISLIVVTKSAIMPPSLEVSAFRLCGNSEDL